MRADETDQHHPVWFAGDNLSSDQKEKLEPYLGEVAARLARSWHRPEHFDSPPCVRFSVFENGDLISLEILIASKDILVDKACLEAVVKACPYSPVPPEICRGGLSFETKFEFPVPQQDKHVLQDTNSVDQSSRTDGQDASMVNK